MALRFPNGRKEEEGHLPNSRFVGSGTSIYHVFAQLVPPSHLLSGRTRMRISPRTLLGSMLQTKPGVRPSKRVCVNATIPPGQRHDYSFP